jgi:putative peptidoglycan lipid II flippase
MPHGGLALANSLATFLEMIGLLYLMRRRLGGLAGRKIWHAAGISTAGAIGMGASLALAHYTNPGLPNILQVLGGAFLGVLSYALLLWVMRMPELRSAWLALRTKVLR